MATVRVVTLVLFALPFTGPLAAFAGTATDQSRFVQPRTQPGEMRFRDMDLNNDGVVTRAEWRGSAQSFRMHDWNGDGILSGNEVRPGAGRDGASIDEQDFDREERFEDLDVNRNGRIERHEWHGSADAFEWLDRNNDGVLNRAEVVGTRRGAVARSQRNRRDPAGAGAAAQQDNCISNPAQVVDDIYQQVLERSADEASAELTRALAEGRMTVRDIVARVAKSPEHAERFFWQPIVATVYRQVLQREPAPQELQSAAADLASGRIRQPEFVARTAVRAANNQDDAVAILYRRLLGREPDPEGLRFHTELARREGIEAVARRIVESPEYRRRAGAAGLSTDDLAAYESAVRSLYRHVLGRDPDPGGLTDLTRIAAARGFDAAIDRMIASPEYERAYGTDVVPGRGIRYCGATR